MLKLSDLEPEITPNNEIISVHRHDARVCLSFAAKNKLRIARFTRFNSFSLDDIQNHSRKRHMKLTVSHVREAGKVISDEIDP